MKKVSKEELVELLKNKQKQTYLELSKITGYHPKYLIQLNQKLKENHYIYVKAKRSSCVSDSIRKQILEDYISHDYHSYLDFFRTCRNQYPVSYSFLCKFLSNTQLDISLLLVIKIKKYQDSHFLAIDYSTRQILYRVQSQKNDISSVKRLLHYILKTYGSPENISFVHCFKTFPKKIEELLQCYNICRIPYKTIYRIACVSSNSGKEKFFGYHTCQVRNEYFLEKITRKTIQSNQIQFDNIRYLILSNIVIPRGEEVFLYYDEDRAPVYILYQNVRYQLKECQTLQSRRGNSKYN